MPREPSGRTQTGGNSERGGVEENAIFGMGPNSNASS